jgi:arylsulfatase A-like enzyme
VTPTVLDLAGAPIPEHLDGRSLVPLIHGEDQVSWRDAVFAEFHGLHFPYPQRMIRTTRYKLIVNPADVDELYDLASDPDELHNRHEDPSLCTIRDDLRRRLREELQQRGNPLHQWLAAMHEVDA